ncbi:uncharacterized protein LOC144742508 [Ciona intestinalis]
MFTYFERAGNGAFDGHCYGTNIPTDTNFTSSLAASTSKISGIRRISSPSVFIGNTSIPSEIVYNTTVKLDIESIYNLGCWNEVQHSSLSSLEARHEVLDTPVSSRAHSFEKCKTAAKILGMAQFALQSGTCYGSQFNDDSYKKAGKSEQCNANGNGGTSSKQVYEIRKYGFETGGCKQVLSRIQCGSSGITEDDCVAKGCCYDSQGIINCFQKLIPAKVDLYNLGCWKNPGNISIPMISSSYLDGEDPVAKCLLTAYTNGFQVFGVDTTGNCYSSAGALSTYRNMGVSRDCTTDGLGGSNSVQVYHIPYITEITEEMLDLGCWYHRNNEPVPHIENSVPELSGPFQNRVNAFEKCKNAAKMFGYKVFGLKNGGKCISSATAGETYMQRGTASTCQSDGLGGLYGAHYYELIVKGDIIQYGSGPFTFRGLEDLTRSLHANALGQIATNMFSSQLYYSIEPGLSGATGSVSFKSASDRNSYITSTSSLTLRLVPFEDTPEFNGAASFVKSEVSGVNVYTYESTNFPGNFIFIGSSNINLQPIPLTTSPAPNVMFTAPTPGNYIHSLYLHDNCETKPHLRINCASSSINREQCLSMGCCWSPIAHFPWCFKKRKSGPSFTNDGWLMNPYTSYQYATIRTGGTQPMENFRSAWLRVGILLMQAFCMKSLTGILNK